MLDERKAAILRAVVQEHIETAQPVGSGTVARSTELAVSPATVRNDMAALEREGYLRQPHTSAGRVPTDKGYRFFVDGLAGHSLDAARATEVRAFFDSAGGRLEELLVQTSRLLSRMTHHAAVVLPPDLEIATVRAVQLVSLTPRLVLVVAVLSSGVVEKESVELEADADEAAVAAAGAHLVRHVVGASMADLPALPPSGDAAVDALSDAALQALARAGRGEDHVILGGIAHMADAFDAVETVRQVLTTLEQQYVVVTLLRDLLDRGMEVAIGAEHGVVPLAECSVVVAPYQLDGEVAGSIAVLGPTRMDYAEAMATVALVSRRLGRALTDG